MIHNTLSKEKLKSQYDCFVALSLEAVKIVAPILEELDHDRMVIIEGNWHELITDALAYGISFILGQKNVSKTIFKEEYRRLTSNVYVIDDEKQVQSINNGKVTRVSEKQLVDYWDRMGLIQEILSVTKKPYFGEVLVSSYIGVLTDFYNYVAVTYGKEGISKYEITPVISKMKTRITEISGIKIH